MRGRKRQKQDIWVVSVEKKPIIIDGKKTGEDYDAYSKPVMYRCSVSATAGTPQEMGAGIIPDYDREITVFNSDMVLHEGELIFIDVIPEFNQDGSLILISEYDEPVTIPDYTVKKVMCTKKGTIARFGISKRV